MSETEPIAMSWTQLQAQEDQLDWIENNQRHPLTRRWTDLTLLALTSVLLSGLIFFGLRVIQHLLHH